MFRVSICGVVDTDSHRVVAMLYRSHPRIPPPLALQMYFPALYPSDEPLIHASVVPVDLIGASKIAYEVEAATASVPADTVNTVDVFDDMILSSA